MVVLGRVEFCGRQDLRMDFSLIRAASRSLLSWADRFVPRCEKIGPPGTGATRNGWWDHGPSRKHPAAGHKRAG